MAAKRTGLGRGIGALIPTTTETATTSRPVDVFFPGARTQAARPVTTSDTEAEPELLEVQGLRLIQVSPALV